MVLYVVDRYDTFLICLFSLVFFMHTIIPYILQQTSFIYGIAFTPLTILILIISRVLRYKLLKRNGTDIESRMDKIMAVNCGVFTCPLFFGIQYALFEPLISKQFMTQDVQLTYYEQKSIEVSTSHYISATYTVLYKEQQLDSAQPVKIQEVVGCGCGDGNQFRGEQDYSYYNLPAYGIIYPRFLCLCKDCYFDTQPNFIANFQSKMYQTQTMYIRIEGDTALAFNNTQCPPPTNNYIHVFNGQSGLQNMHLQVGLVFSIVYCFLYQPSLIIFIFIVFKRVLCNYVYEKTERKIRLQHIIREDTDLQMLQQETGIKQIMHNIGNTDMQGQINIEMHKQANHDNDSFQSDEEQYEQEYGLQQHPQQQMQQQQLRSKLQLNNAQNNNSLIQSPKQEKQRNENLNDSQEEFDIKEYINDIKRNAVQQQPKSPKKTINITNIGQSIAGIFK